MVFPRLAARAGALSCAVFAALSTVPAAAAPAPPDVPALLAAETGARARQAWADAIDDTDRVLEAEHDNIQALLDRATSEQAIGCTAAGYINAMEVLRLDPGNTAAAAYAGPPRPTPAELPPPVGEDAGKWMEWGMSAFCAGRDRQALRAFDRAIALGRDRADALNDRGVALTMLGRYADAVAALDGAIALRPRYAQAYANRGNAYFRSGDGARAIADLDTAIGLRPRLAFAYMERGAVREAAHDHAGALADDQMAATLMPDRAQPLSRWGMCWRRRAIPQGPSRLSRRQSRRSPAMPTPITSAASSSTGQAITIRRSWTTRRASRSSRTMRPFWPIAVPASANSGTTTPRSSISAAPWTFDPTCAMHCWVEA